MSGLLSKSSKLGYSSSGTNPITYTNLPDLQSIGEIFGTPEQIDVTTLADSRKKYISGLADSGQIECKFLFANGANDSFRKLKGLEGTLTYWQIELPDSTKLSFDGYVNVSIDGIDVNSAITFTAILTVNSDITVTNPA